MEFLVDSDIVIWFLKGREKESRLLEDLSRKGDLLISVVTITEVRAGLKSGPGASKIINQLQEIFQLVSLDPEIAEMAGAFKQKYRLAIADMFIAASAVAAGAILVTNNKKHFPMPEVKLYRR